MLSSLSSGYRDLICRYKMSGAGNDMFSGDDFDVNGEVIVRVLKIEVPNCVFL